MAQSQQKLPKGGKNVQRGNRLHSHTSSMRPHHIQNARNRHLKNATRSCGAKFAEKLRLYYARIGVLSAPKKCEKRRASAI